MNIQELDKTTIQCMVVECNEKIAASSKKYFQLKLELMEGENVGKEVNAMSFQQMLKDSAYPITFSISAKNKDVLIANRPKSTDEQKAELERKNKASELSARELRLQKEAKEKAEYEADQKRRGLSDVPQTHSPASNLIRETPKEQLEVALRYKYSENDMKLMRTNGIIPPETPVDQVDFFFKTAQLFGANPLMKQIYLLPFRSGGETKYAHVISIDLARAKAHETGEFAGKSKVYFDGLPMHQWIKENPTIEFEEKQIQRGKYTNKEQHLKEGCHFPLTAEVTIYRMVNGQRCEFFHEVAFEEYYPGPSGRGQMWRQRPFGMIGKCVEMAALRSAFADSLGKMYVQEELEKAHTPETQDTAFIDLSNIAKEIEACETVDQIHAHKASHSELQNDPDYLKLLEQRAIEITNN